jgi:hypothetical protein
MPTPKIDKEGNVTIDGEHIGRVWKGERRSSPPVRRGSPVVKYHKQIPCWRSSSNPSIAHDTRKDAVSRLVTLWEWDQQPK